MRKNSQLPTILLSIETKAREFPGKVLLASFLAEKGFRIVLTKNRKETEVKKYNAWLFIDRNTFAPRFKFFKNLKLMATRLVCIDEEGVVWIHPEHYKKRLHSRTNGLVDVYCTWGKKQTELVKQVNNRVNVVETGNPRIDLFRPELTALYESKSKAIKNKYGDFVLIVSNFASCNHYYSKETNELPVEVKIQQLKYQGLIRTKEQEEFERRFFYNRLEVFNKIHDAVKYLSKRFPELKFIIRPHPSENHEVWKEAMKGFQNVLVIFEGELTPWILAAKAVIHNSCTSGLESALLQRKAIAYIPLHEPQFECDLPNKVSAIAKNEVEIADMIMRSPIYQQIPDIIHEYISSLTGTMASEKIVQTIERLYQLKQPFFKIIIRNMIFGIMSIIIKIKNIFKRKQNHEPKKIFKDIEARNKYFSQKLSSITAEETLEYIAIYKKLLGKFEHIAIYQDDGNIVFYDTRYT